MLQCRGGDHEEAQRGLREWHCYSKRMYTHTCTLHTHTYTQTYTYKCIHIHILYFCTQMLLFAGFQGISQISLEFLLPLDCLFPYTAITSWMFLRFYAKKHRGWVDGASNIYTSHVSKNVCQSSPWLSVRVDLEIWLFVKYVILWFLNDRMWIADDLNGDKRGKEDTAFRNMKSCWVSRR